MLSRSTKGIILNNYNSCIYGCIYERLKEECPKAIQIMDLWYKGANSEDGFVLACTYASIEFDSGKDEYVFFAYDPSKKLSEGGRYESINMKEFFHIPQWFIEHINNV